MAISNLFQCCTSTCSFVLFHIQRRWLRFQTRHLRDWSSCVRGDNHASRQGVRMSRVSVGFEKARIPMVMGSLGERKIHLILGLPTIFLNSWGHPSSHIWQVQCFHPCVSSPLVVGWLVGWHCVSLSVWVLKHIFTRLSPTFVDGSNPALMEGDSLCWCDWCVSTNQYMAHVFTYILPPKLLKCPQADQPHWVSGILPRKKTYPL